MELKTIPTEQRNQDTLNIDEVGVLEILKMINEEDQKAALCVKKHLDKIAVAVDAIAEKFAAGGRVVYSGAGNSGRAGIMDASEWSPTFNVPEGRVVALMAGGAGATNQPIESAEDNKEWGAKDLKDICFNKNDVLVGLAASGRTPYVVGAVEYAKSLGALTVSITCNEDLNSPLNSLVDYPIGIYAGPEAITGSTRMKAGTVQKMVTNMLSTAIMVKAGKVYSNLMVNVQTKNEKLRARAKSIIAEITNAADNEIDEVLRLTNDDVSLSILILLTGCKKQEAESLMAESGGHIKKALSIYRTKN